LFIEDMEQNLDMIQAGRGDQILTIFDSDPVQEIAYIQDHIESAKMMIEWYGESV
jgi:transcription termination factor Rho